DLAVLLPDDLIDAKVPCLAQMMEAQKRTGADMVVALMEVLPEEVCKYGIVDGTLIDERTFSITRMVEKPPLESAPSHFAIIGRYLFSSELFRYLAMTQKGLGGEIQLTDAMDAMLSDGKKAIGYLFDGKRFDTGNVFGYIEANLHYALKRDELKLPLKAMLKEILDR
ncbi:UTP--glucose-1-phosphate uridylyltransferase, partial [Myxococcota bacterium]|nr:UTP--glucose-1-phosphate uridylyltransferase [Myxococcota bacterium]